MGEDLTRQEKRELSSAQKVIDQNVEGDVGGEGQQGADVVPIGSGKKDSEQSQPEETRMAAKKTNPKAEGDADEVVDADVEGDASEVEAAGEKEAAPEESVDEAETTEVDESPEKTPAKDVATEEKQKPLTRTEGHVGNEVKVHLSSGRAKIDKRDAIYKVVEANDIKASHKVSGGGKFAENEDYVKNVQPRTYSGESAKAVLERADNYEPDQVMNTDVGPNTGPPMVTEDGHVLGGNSRTMIRIVAMRLETTWLRTQKSLA